ncbi:hypothetical protein SEPCBS119000_006768, partial [Sporothrix epigloea]
GDGIIPETWHSYSLAIQERFRDPSEARKNLRKIQDLRYEGDIHSYLSQLHHLNVAARFHGTAFQQHLLDVLPDGITDIIYSRPGGIPDNDKTFLEAVVAAGISHESKTANRPSKLTDTRRWQAKPEPPRPNVSNESRTFPRLRPTTLWHSPTAALKDVERADTDRHRQTGASCIRCGRNNHTILDCFSTKSVTGKVLPSPPTVAGVKRAPSDADEVATPDSKKARIDAVSAAPSNFFAHDDDEDNFENEEDFS